MYAVVTTGGKQHKVSAGEEVVVEKLDAAPGDTVTFNVVFLSDGEQITVDPDTLASATVTAEVVEHFKDDKVMIFKFKKRKGYKRTRGHRQNLTRVMITDVAAGAAPKKAEAKKPVKKAAPKAKAEEAVETTEVQAATIEAHEATVVTEDAPAVEAAEAPKKKAAPRKKKADADTAPANDEA